MKPEIARQLICLNRDFYDQFATEFAQSRSSFPGGILRALETVSSSESLLDVGCGDGRVGRALASAKVPNRVRRYRGVDISVKLLEQPTESIDPLPEDFHLVEGDLTEPGWSTLPGIGSETFEAAVSFSVLFHIPGVDRRHRLLQEIFEQLRPDSRFILSVWQFLHVPRIEKKIVDWSELDLEPADLDEGDLLLDWWRGGRGLRYIHHFDDTELLDLCRAAGFEVEDTYRSDGATGDMSLFVVLRHP